MFPRLRQRLGPALLSRLDALVELGTLGEYGIAEDGRPLALECRAAESSAASAPLVARTRDVCPFAEQSMGRCRDASARP